MLMWFGGQEALNKTVVLSVLQKSALGQQQQHGGGSRGCPLVGYASSQGRAHGPGKVSSVRLRGHVVHTLNDRYCTVGDKTRLLSREKYLVAINITIFVTTKLLSRYIFVGTNIVTLRQKFCRDKHTFVVTKDVVCRDKHMFVLSRQKPYLWRFYFSVIPA